jgi:hypothetical protein
MEHDKQLREQVAKVMDWNEASPMLSGASFPIVSLVEGRYRR